jgi:hypothetical protein
MIRRALLIGIGFFVFGLLGLLIAALLAHHAFCFAPCTSLYEDFLVRFAIRLYGLISMGIGSLFVLVGAFGNAIQAS